MELQDYLSTLPKNRNLSEVKYKILTRLWGKDCDSFPKPWVSSAELLDLTGQKYFDRRTRELRDQLGCDIESEYRTSFSGHGWRLKSSSVSPPQDRNYLSAKQKAALFEKYNSTCATCGTVTKAGVRGLQADHKIPLSRGGGNDLVNWQPLCNNCNVGKRRACEGCDLDCKTCSWAFPEQVGIQTIVSLSEETLRVANKIMSSNSISLDKLIDQAIKDFSKSKDI